MPTHRVLEEYARRVEREMSPAANKEGPAKTTKKCPVCGAECGKSQTSCADCGHEFPPAPLRMKKCHECDALNPMAVDECQQCGAPFRHEYEVTLNEALRMGAIIRGMDLNEEEVVEGEENKDEIRNAALKSGDDTIIRLLKQLPEESWGRLRRIMAADRDKQ